MNLDLENIALKLFHQRRPPAAGGTEWGPKSLEGLEPGVDEGSTGPRWPLGDPLTCVLTGAAAPRAPSPRERSAPGEVAATVACEGCGESSLRGEFSGAGSSWPAGLQ